MRQSTESVGCARPASHARDGKRGERRNAPPSRNAVAPPSRLAGPILLCLRGIFLFLPYRDTSVTLSFPRHPARPPAPDVGSCRDDVVGDRPAPHGRQRPAAITRQFGGRAWLRRTGTIPAAVSSRRKGADPRRTAVSFSLCCGMRVPRAYSVRPIQSIERRARRHCRSIFPILRSGCCAVLRAPSTICVAPRFPGPFQLPSVIRRRRRGGRVLLGGSAPGLRARCQAE